MSEKAMEEEDLPVIGHPLEILLKEGAQNPRTVRRQNRHGALHRQDGHRILRLQDHPGALRLLDRPEALRLQGHTGALRLQNHTGALLPQGHPGILHLQDRHEILCLQKIPGFMITLCQMKTTTIEIKSEAKHGHGFFC